jgi:LacI family transcriptional regulator
MASMKDVARHACVSVGTVSNVLNRPGSVSEETRRRVEASIAALGFVRSDAARQLRAGRSRIVALLALDVGNPFYVDIARGAERVAQGCGLGVMVCDSNQSSRKEAEYLALFAEQRVRGVLLTPTEASSGKSLEALRRSRTPYVLVDRASEGGKSCSVSVDDVFGGTLAARHLLSTGHRHIAFVSGRADLEQIRDRRSGVLAALAEADHGGEVLVELPTDGLDVAAGRDAGARLLGLPRRPTAVLCANDLLALGVLQALFAAGVSVPHDLAAAAAVPLTSVRQPATAMGAISAELLLEEAEAGPTHQHRHVVLQPELVVRASTLAR